MTLLNPITRLDDGREIPGESFPAIIHNGGYYLANIGVFKDGKIDCWGLVDLAGFREKLDSGGVLVQVPDGTKIDLQGIGYGWIHQPRWEKSSDDFYREVADAIEELNGRPTSSERCIDAFTLYESNPGSQNLENLRRAYEAVPKHLRNRLKRQGTADYPIRLILYGPTALPPRP